MLSRIAFAVGLSCHGCADQPAGLVDDAFDHGIRRGTDEASAVAGFLREGFPRVCVDVADPGGSVDAHREPGGQLGIGGGTHEVVERCEGGGAGVVEEREVLGVCVAVAYQPVEDESTPERRKVLSGHGRAVAQQLDGLDNRRSSLGLILAVGRTAKRLTDVLLVQPADGLGSHVAVVALDQQVGEAGDGGPLVSEGSGQFHNTRQLHAEGLVVDETWKARGLRLEDVRCRGSCIQG